MQLVASEARQAALGARGSGGWQQQRRQQQQRQRRSRALPPPRAGGGGGGFFKDLFDFESWAPRSSQAWRLGNNIHEASEPRQGSDEGDVDVLNRRLADARREGAAVPAADADAAAATDSAAAAAAEEAAAAAPSFLRSTDEEVAASLLGRISEVASAMGTGGSSVDSDEEGRVDGGALTGPLLRELIETKWGKAYDLSFVRRDLPLGKRLICLNVMWVHLEQRAFPMTEEEYDEKLELIALYLNSWGQAERVETYLRQPARPRKGMPSKPIVGTAISIQLDPDDAVIDEFFSQGGS